MAKIFFNFRTCDTIFDCTLYSKELAPVNLDEGDKIVKLFFLADKFQSDLHHTTFISDEDKTAQKEDTQISDKPCMTAKRCIHTQNVLGNPEGDFETSVHERIVSKNGITTTLDSTETRSEEAEDETFTLCVVPNRKCVLLMDAHLVSCVANEIHRSHRFRRRFLLYLSHTFGFRICDYDDVDFFHLKCDNFLSVPYMVDVISLWTKQKLDYPWDARISGLLTKRMLLEEAMAWLSTLGGGYSALGDYDIIHAVTAGEVSLKQMKIAMELDDPLMAARCRLFWALSRMQLGHLNECKKIVKRQYVCIQHSNWLDDRLVNMCLAIWNRLQYMYKLRKYGTTGIKRKHKDQSTVVPY